MLSTSVEGLAIGQSLADDRLVKDMRKYILSAKAFIGITECERCGMPATNIHHLRYGSDVTIYDLELLCEDCHWAIPTTTD